MHTWVESDQNASSEGVEGVPVVQLVRVCCVCFTLRVFPCLCSPSAGAAPRADEAEPGGPVQRAGGEAASVRGGEGQLGGPAANPGAAEAGRLQVSTAQHTLHRRLAVATQSDQMWCRFVVPFPPWAANPR